MPVPAYGLFDKREMPLMESSHGGNQADRFSGGNCPAPSTVIAYGFVYEHVGIACIILPRAQGREIIGTPGRPADSFRKQLESCMERDDQGRLKLTVTVPDEDTLSSMASSLARLAAFGSPNQ